MHVSYVVAPEIGASRACNSISALGQRVRGQSEPLVHGHEIFFEDLQASWECLSALLSRSESQLGITKDDRFCHTTSVGETPSVGTR